MLLAASCQGAPCIGAEAATLAGALTLTTSEASLELNLTLVFSVLEIDTPENLHTFRHEAMATDFVFSLGGDDATYASQAAQEAFRLVDAVEDKLSLYRESSDVTRINRARPGDQVRVSAECVQCLQSAFEASRLTGDRFHIFVGAEACRAKGLLPAHLEDTCVTMDPSEGEEPSIAVDAAARQVARLSGNALLDLGGIGKGFALDQASELLREWDLPLAVLSAGGSTLLFLAPEGNAPWRGRLGNQEFSPFGTGALASSGLGFQPNHIIDPNTRAATTLWQRTFARTGEAALADGLSTGAMLMAQEQIERLVSRDSTLALAVQDREDALRRFGSFFCGGEA